MPPWYLPNPGRRTECYRQWCEQYCRGAQKKRIFSRTSFNTLAVHSSSIHVSILPSNAHASSLAGVAVCIGAPPPSRIRCKTRNHTSRSVQAISPNLWVIERFIERIRPSCPTGGNHWSRPIQRPTTAPPSSRRTRSLNRDTGRKPVSYLHLHVYAIPIH